MLGMLTNKIVQRANGAKQLAFVYHLTNRTRYFLIGHLGNFLCNGDCFMRGRIWHNQAWLKNRCSLLRWCYSRFLDSESCVDALCVELGGTRLGLRNFVSQIDVSFPVANALRLLRNGRRSDRQLAYEVS